ncbi:MAG: hypothetical protein K2M19_07495 [Muribaculaceae bacterium]|nr:hypothetical protein [Muribaculaceae bacterium]
MAPARGLDAHLRIEPKRGTLAGWESADGTALTVKFENARPDNDWTGLTMLIRNAGSSMTVQTLPGVSTESISLLLKARPDSTILEIAHARDRRRIVLPTVLSLSERPATVAEKCKVLRDECSVLPEDCGPARVDRFEDVSMLTEYLRASTDPAEGLWRHYDHKTHPLKAVPGGHYTLATVRRPDSDVYDIIYIHGAENSGHWNPLDLKGRLIPSPIPGMFDLEWITDDRITVSHNSWATADALLTLSFPQWEATLRLARIEP